MDGKGPGVSDATADGGLSMARAAKAAPIDPMALPHARKLLISWLLSQLGSFRRFQAP